MKYILMALSIAAATLSAPASAQVSINIGQPGFYGRLDIGGFPPPPLLFPEPMMIQRVPVSRPPLYLRVPPGHARHWGKHCHRYRACGERVYFVQDTWYQQEYAPVYRERHGHRDHRHDYRDDHRREQQQYYRIEQRRDERRDYRDDHRDRDRRDDRGRGRGDDDHGHKHGRDH